MKKISCIVATALIIASPFLFSQDSGATKTLERAWVKGRTNTLRTLYLDAAELKDGSIVAIGNSDAIYEMSGLSNGITTKYDANGTKLWEKTDHLEGTALTYSDELPWGMRYYNDITATSDGGYVLTVLESILGDPNYTYTHYIEKYDKNGSMLWRQLHHISESYDCNPIVIETSNGDIVVIGSNSNNNDEDFIAKYSSAGSKLWEKTFASGHRYSPVAADNGTDGSIYVAYTNYDHLYSGSGKISTTIAKFDTNGNTLWSKNIFHVDGTSPADIEALSDGNAALIYRTEGLSAKRGHLVKFSGSNGQQIWNIEFEGNQQGYFTHLAETADHSIVTIGETSATDIPGITIISDYADVSIIHEYDQNGNILYREGWGVNVRDSLNNVMVSSTGNIYIVGMADDNGNPGVPTFDRDTSSLALIMKYNDKNVVELGYTISPSYTVVIPADIQMSDESTYITSEVSVSDVTLEQGKTLKVAMQPTNAKLQYNDTNYIEYNISINDGWDFKAAKTSYQLVNLAAGGSDAATGTFKVTPSTDHTHARFAGRYSDTLTFTVSVQ